MLPPDDAFAIDENQFGNVTRLARRVLEIITHLLARGKADGKGGLKLRDESRHELLRAIVKRDSDNLQPARSKILLNAAQNLSGSLAMRSSSEHEREQHHFSGVLAQQNLAAAVHANGKLVRGTWNLLGERHGCHQRKAGCGNWIAKSHDASVTQRVKGRAMLF
jgi:hypothetical protein